MKSLIVVITVVIMSGCTSPKMIRMDSGIDYVIENEGKPIFSLRVPENGEWYLGAVGTMKWGMINFQGKPDNSYVGYALNFSIKTGSWPSFLKRVIPPLKTGDYDGYMRDTLDRYTPERLAEEKKSNPGGKVIDVRGLQCKNFWVSEHIGPNINNPRYGGQGISVYGSYIGCPLVIDGVIYEFEVGIRSSILDKLYLEKEEYDRTKKPEDPEFIIDPEAIMRDLGESVVEMFSTLKIYGNISQSYEDVAMKCHPTLGDEC